MTLLKTITLCGVMLTCAESSVHAQPAPPPAEMAGWWLLPSLRTAGVYEDNLRSTGALRDIGSLLRVTPSVEIRHRSPLRSSFVAGYSFDSELYSQRFRALDDRFARRAGGINFDANITPRLVFFSRARHTSTRRPEEVLDEIGLVPAQRRTINYGAEAGVTSGLTPRTSGSVVYAFTFDDYGPPGDERPSARTAQHATTADFSFKQSDRMTVAVEYGGKLLVGDDLTTHAVAHAIYWSNTVAVRWSHSIAPNVTAVILAGPRVSQALPRLIVPAERTPFAWETSPEVLASLTYRRDAQRLSVAYARSAFRGVGASGFISTESLDVRAAYSFGSKVRAAARPAVYRNTLAGVEARGYRFDGAVEYQLSSWMTLETIYLYKRQERALSLVDVDVGSQGRPRTRNSIMFGANVRRPIRMR